VVLEGCWWRSRKADLPVFERNWLIFHRSLSGISTVISEPLGRGDPRDIYLLDGTASCYALLCGELAEN